MWPIWIAVAVLILGHVAVFFVTTTTPYSVCLSQLKVYGPDERDRIIRARVAGFRGQGGAADYLTGCCDLSKDAGEFSLSYKTYLESGTIWVIRRTAVSANVETLGFFTNCGEVLSEQEYYDRYVV